MRSLQLSRQTLRTIHQNLGWAFGYNTAATPWPHSGCSTPSWQARRWALSSVSVVTNSLRLRHFGRDKTMEALSERPATT